METNKFERKISVKKNSYMINIPMVFAKELNLSQGDTVQIYKNEKNEIVIVPVEQQEQGEKDNGLNK